MRTILKFKILMILWILLLTPLLVSAQEKTDPGSAKEKNPDKLTIKKIDDAVKKPDAPVLKSDKNSVELPAIEGWERGDVQTYPSAALGYSVTYQSEDGGRATVYVYDGGLKSIPDGANDKVIKEEIDRAKNEIVQIGRLGIYEGVKEVKNDTVTLGGANGKVKALRSLFYFKVKGEELDSEIYLFGYNNKFIKIRSTRAAAAGGENKALSAFLAEIDKFFAR